MSWQPGPPGPYGAWPVPPPSAATPSVGVIADAVLALSEKDRERLYKLLGVVDASAAKAGRGALPVPPTSGHTVRPSDGKVFKISPQAERSTEFQQLQTAYNEAAKSLKDYTTSKGWKTSPVKKADGSISWAVTTQEGGKVLDIEHSRREAALKTAKLAVSAYKKAHPEEFREPPRKGGSGGDPEAGPSTSRGGKGKGRTT